MSEILKLLLFNAAVIVGVNFATKEDQILGPLGDEIRKLPEWASKPISECPPCQSSVWGTLVYWLFGPRNILLFPFYICGLCGLVRLLNLTLEAVRAEAETAPKDD